MANTPKVFESEYRFCLILWENEPMTCSNLAKLAKEKLEWSRTTTYTVIKRLCDRGVLANNDSVITSIVSKDEIQLAELEEIYEKRFENNLPAFIAAFAKQQNLSEADVEEIKRIIDGAGK